MILNPGLVGVPAGDDLSPSIATLPARLSFVAVSIWWMLFARPLLRHVPEPAVRALSEEERRQGALRAAVSRLKRTFRELRRYRNAFVMLLASLIYNDGIGTIYRMAPIYGRI